MSRSHALHRSAGAHPLRQALRFNQLKRRSRATSAITATDVREFLMAYCACFLAVSTFIA